MVDFSHSTLIGFLGDCPSSCLLLSSLLFLTQDGDGALCGGGNLGEGEGARLSAAGLGGHSGAFREGDGDGGFRMGRLVVMGNGSRAGLLEA